MKIEYHPLTVSDLNQAVAFYNRQHPGLGEEFRSEVHAAIARVRSNPGLFPPIEHGIRRCFVHHFPFAVLYRLIGETTVRVLVIRHHRRHPGFGIERR
jgi:plasmid stabilization system protein ParE